jgi:23S rRNA (guanosine2251-2'-O)-methyltransferase
VNHEHKKVEGDEWIWGRHSVEAALEICPEWILELIVDLESEELHADLIKSCEEQGISHLRAAKLPSSLKGRRHQGIAAKMKRFPFEYFNQFREKLGSLVQSGGVIAVLDRVQDPQNYGAILRSAAGLGVQAVLVAQKHQCPLTGAVAQASAGAMFRVPIVLCPSLASALDALKSDGAKVYALDMAGTSIDELALRPPDRPKSLVWLLGSEGQGVREDLAKKADEICSIALHAGLESLNVSATAAIAFFSSRD